MDEPIIVTNGRFSISVEVRKPSRNVDFGIKFDPSDRPPPGAKKWWDINDNPVIKGPNNSWKLDKNIKETKLQKRMGVAYDRNVAPQKTQEKVKDSGEVIEKAYSLSENLIKNLLLANNDSSKMELRADFESKIDDLILAENTKKTWKEATYASTEAIQNFLKTKGQNIKGVEHVGNSTQEDKFFTSDLLITTTDGKKLGVSLKKNGNTRMLNTSINEDEHVKKFFEEQENLLRMFAPPELKNKKFNRSIRKEILESQGDKKTKIKKIDGESLDERLLKLRNGLRKDLEDEVDAATHINKISGKVNKIFDAIDNGTLIIVASGSIFSSEELNKLNNKTSEELNNFDAKNGENFIRKGGVSIARIGIRQDGIGYGTSMKLEATFVGSFVKNYFTKYTND